MYGVARPWQTVFYGRIDRSVSQYYSRLRREPRSPFENSELPEGTQVLITPVQSLIAKAVKEDSLEQFKQEVHRIASLACESDTDDSFSGADHDKLLYGGGV